MPSGSKKYQITAIAYDKKGNIISVGRNSYTKTHPLQAKFAKKAGKPNGIFLHAEIDALIRARGNVYRLVVTRFNSKGEPVTAEPCPICKLAIKSFNVKIVETT